MFRIENSYKNREHKTKLSKRTNERNTRREMVSTQQLAYTRHQALYAITIGNEFVSLDKGENGNA